MSVEDWARREAAVKFPKLLRGEYERYDDFDSRMDIRDSAVVGVEWMAVHAFSALLSDKTWDFLSEWNDEEEESLTRAQAIRLVRAAIAAVTEGDTE